MVGLGAVRAEKRKPGGWLEPVAGAGSWGLRLLDTGRFVGRKMRGRVYCAQF